MMMNMSEGEEEEMSGVLCENGKWKRRGRRILYSDEKGKYV
jgi:hypothetical protein